MQDNLFVCIKNSVSPEMYEDLEKQVKVLKEEAASWRELYLDKAQKAYDSDLIVQNQKKIIENTGKVLEELTKENGHLVGLMNIYTKRREAK